MYDWLLTSAPSKEESETILRAFLQQRLVAGGKITQGDSHHWWRNEIESMPYWTISAYTRNDKREAIIKRVEKMHSDEAPLVLFFAVDHANATFGKWIDESLNV